MTNSRSTFRSVLPLAASILVSGSIPFCTDSAAAVELNGKFTSELYTWIERDRDHIRPYESVRADLTAWRGGQRQEISFVSYLRWTTDLRDKFRSDPETFVYDAYVRLAHFPEGAAIHIGRQFVYSSVGSAHIDGVNLRYRPLQHLNLDLFGGSAVNRLEPETVRSFSDFGVLGGRISILPLESTRIGLNWIRRRTNGSIDYHRLGSDAQQSLRFWRLYARVAYDVENRRLTETITRVAYSPDRWFFSAEFSRRQPSVGANSVFSLIDFDNPKQLRAEVRRTLRSNLTLVSQVTTTLHSGKDSQRLSLGFRSRTWSIDWYHQSGLGSDSDGLRGSANLQLGDDWTVFAGANLNRYRVQPEQPDRMDAYAASLSIFKRLSKGLAARVQGQLLSNAVQKHDMRVLVSITKNFSLGTGE